MMDSEQQPALSGIVGVLSRQRGLQRVLDFPLYCCYLIPSAASSSRVTSMPPQQTIADLPVPCSGQFLEISFRRLLRSCGDIMQGDTKGREDLQDWQHSPVFHHVSA